MKQLVPIFCVIWSVAKTLWPTIHRIPRFTRNDNAIVVVVLFVTLLVIGLRPIPAQAATITVNSTAQEVPFVNNGNCTLGEAIESAETDSAIDGCIAGNGDDIINVPAGTYLLTAGHVICSSGGNVDSECAFPIIDTRITIIGAGSQDTLIERDTNASRFRHFRIGATGDLTLRNLTLSKGSLGLTSPNMGGSIVMSGSSILTTNDVRFVSNLSQAAGGAIASFDATAQINLTNSEFVGNVGGDSGGAIYKGHLTLINTDFTNNNATTGGAVSEPLSLSVTGGEFSDNVGGSYGGGINICNDVTFTNVDFQRNHANFGGGLNVYRCGATDPTVTIQHSSFISNTATSFGGGIYARRTVLSLTESEFIENRTIASGNTFSGGGALYALEATVDGEQLHVQDNKGLSAGGFFVDVSTAQLNRVVFTGNRAQNWIGGAVRLTRGGTATIENSTISDNRATNGALASDNGGGIFTIIHSTITDNTGNGTGGLYDGNGGVQTHQIQSSILAGNDNGSGEGDFLLVCSSGCKTLESLGNNIIGAEGRIGTYTPAMGDTVGTIGMPVSADIHPLQKLGGHWLHLPIAGGNVMDAITPGEDSCGATFLVDQRGKTRPVDYTGDNHCDIGAIERQSAEIHTDFVERLQSLSYGGLQVTLTDNGVYRGALGNVTVIRSNQFPTNTLNDAMPIQVTLTEPVNPERLAHDVNYDIEICYTDWELAQGANVNEGTLGFLQKVGTNWQYVEPTVRDEANNCIRLDGVESYDTWGLGSTGAPTAVQVGGISVDVNAFPLLLLILLGSATILVANGRPRWSRSK